MLLCRGGLGFAYYPPQTRNAKSSHMLESPAELLLLWHETKQTMQESGEHHAVLCWRDIWRIRHPKSAFSICPKIVGESGYDQTWWVESGLGCHCHTVTVLDYLQPPQLRQPDWHKHSFMAEESDLSLLHCRVEQADADCSSLFAESCWLDVSNSTACEPAWLGEDGAMGTVQCGPMGFAEVARQKEINPVWQNCIFSFSRLMRWDFVMYFFLCPSQSAKLFLRLRTLIPWWILISQVSWEFKLHTKWN